MTTIKSCGVTATNRPYVLFNDYVEVLYYEAEFNTMRGALNFLQDLIVEPEDIHEDTWLTRVELQDMLKD